MVMKMNRFFQRLKAIPYRVEVLYHQYLYPSKENDAKNPKVLMGKILAEMNSQKSSISKLSEVEFQVFSQFGDDGIIQYLVKKLDIPYLTFIEFGVENYHEANTRFLLVNNNWSGMVIDGSAENIRKIKGDVISWGQELVALEAFIDAENINELISIFLNIGFNKEIGILSIDIDGIDYWVWKAIDVVNPVIVIMEYNSLLGNDKPYTIPYDPTFVRNNRYNIFYWGSSLPALCELAKEKNYAFIGCNLAGNNAYFIRRDKMNSSVTEYDCSEGFVMSKFRELVDETGYRPLANERLAYLKGLPLYNIKTNQIENFEI